MGRLLLSKGGRRRYEQVSQRAGRVCVAMGLSADALTLMSILLAGVAAALLATERFWWAIAAGAVSGCLDMLDGATARASGKDGRFGTVLDRAADRLNEMLFLLGMLLSGRVPPGLVLVTLFALLAPSYVRAVAESAGGVPDCEVGLAGRLEKLVVLTIGVALEAIFPGWRPLTWALGLAAVLGAVTAVQRIAHARRQAGPRGGQGKPEENVVP